MPPSSQFPIFSYASEATQRVSYIMLYPRLAYIVILHPSTLGSLAYWRCTRCILWVLPKRGCIPAFPRFMSLRVCMLRKKHLFFFNDAAEICHHYRRFSRHFWNNLVCCGGDFSATQTINHSNSTKYHLLLQASSDIKTIVGLGWGVDTKKNKRNETEF